MRLTVEILIEIAGVFSYCSRIVRDFTGRKTDARDELRERARFFEIKEIRRAGVNLVDMLKSSPDEGTPSFVIEEFIKFFSLII